MSKPEKLLLGYIEVRGRALEEIYNLIRVKGKSNIRQVSDYFAAKELNPEKIEESPVKDYLNFLTSVGLLERVAGEIVSYKVSPGPELSFRLLLLRSLTECEDKAFRRLNALMANMDLLDPDTSFLVAEAEKKIELGFTWNREKVQFFRNIAEYIGLGQRYESRFLNLPSRKLISEIIQYYSRKKKKEELPLRGTLDDISSEFLESWTSKSQVYQGLQSTFLGLQSEGLIELRMESDARDRFSPVQIGDAKHSLVVVKT